MIQGLDKQGQGIQAAGGVTHIGAIYEDGGRKDEIVLRDGNRRSPGSIVRSHKRDGRIFLVDCASANGTGVESRTAKPGTPVKLKNGARVTLAESCAVKLRFGWHTEDSSNA